MEYKNMSPLYPESKMAVNDIVNNWRSVIEEKEKLGELDPSVSGDDIFRFMTYWVAFNTLYSEYYQNLGNDNNGESYKKLRESYKKLEEYNYKLLGNYENISYNYFSINSYRKLESDKYLFERTQISMYIDSKINNLCEYGFENLIKGCGEITKKPVIEGSEESKEFEDIVKESKYNKYSYHYICMFKDDNAPEKIKIQSLFQTIYQIRCNLFHGSKNPKMNRDLRLVSDAARIMRRTLEALEINPDNSITDYDKIKNSIESIKSEAQDNNKLKSEWGGADLVIASIDKEEETREFADENKNITVVITDEAKAKAIICLINIMKHYAKIDYLSKFDYYKIIGETANEYLKTDIDTLLTNILNAVTEKGYIEK